MLDYRAAFSHLHTDRNQHRWGSRTRGRAPHKPLLLLSVLDLAAHARLTGGLVELSPELMETFERYWLQVMGPERRGDILLPFFHLQSDGFWRLAPKPGREAEVAALSGLRSFRQARELLLGAQLDAELFLVLQQPLDREALRQALLETYFDAAAQQAIAQAGVIAAQSFEYEHQLEHQAELPFALERPTADETYQPEARSAAFRREVVRAYDHACAMCGLRLITSEGRTAVEAAHIVPWSEVHNDDPRNGLALCRLHHWTFDYGVVGVQPDYVIQVSPLTDDQTLGQRLLQDLHGQPLRMPQAPQLYPARPALEWRWGRFKRQARQALW